MEKRSFYSDIQRMADSITSVDVAVQKAKGAQGDVQETRAELKEKAEELRELCLDETWQRYKEQIQQELAELRNQVSDLLSQKETGEAEAAAIYQRLQGADETQVQSQMQRTKGEIAAVRSRMESLLRRNAELVQELKVKKEKLKQKEKQKRIYDFIVAMAIYQGRSIQEVWYIMSSGKLFVPQEKKNTQKKDDQLNFFDLLSQIVFSKEAKQLHEKFKKKLDHAAKRTYDFTQESHRYQVKEDTVEELQQMSQEEKLCQDDSHKNSPEYEAMMEAQRALTGDINDPEDQKRCKEAASKMSLEEMHEKLIALQKAAATYVKAKMDQGGPHGVPRREARLVYATALQQFVTTQAERINEAIRMRETEKLPLTGEMQYDFTKNYIQALGEMVKDQAGADPFAATEEAAVIKKEEKPAPAMQIGK